MYLGGKIGARSQPGPSYLKISKISRKISSAVTHVVKSMQSWPSLPSNDLQWWNDLRYMFAFSIQLSFFSFFSRFRENVEKMLRSSLAGHGQLCQKGLRNELKEGFLPTPMLPCFNWTQILLFISVILNQMILNKTNAYVLKCFIQDIRMFKAFNSRVKKCKTFLLLLYTPTDWIQISSHFLFYKMFSLNRFVRNFTVEFKWVQAGYFVFWGEAAFSLSS